MPLKFGNRHRETSMSRRLLILLASLCMLAPIHAQEPSAADAEFFTRKVKPILQKNCFSCHSHEAKKAKGQLMVDSRAALLKGGESGPAFDAKDPAQSLLLKAIG